MFNAARQIALKDIVESIKRFPLVGTLGWQDVKQRYRRSALGPFWLTLSMGIMIGSIGIVFGQIFQTPMKEYLPFLASGVILWTFISTVILEGCTGFIAAEGIIKQLPIPLFVHILRIIWRNALILGHNIVILPLVFLIMGKGFSWVIFLSLPGIIVALSNLAWISLLLGILSSRYRDLPQIVSSVLQILFYITPIMWMPSHMPDRVGNSILLMNPVFHTMEIIRAPLLGQVPSIENWAVSIGLTVVGWAATLLLYGKYKRRIAYWL